MLEDGGPFQVLRFATEAVNFFFIKNQQASRRRVTAGLIIARVAAGKAAAIYPVTAVEPRVIEETGGAKNVRGIAALL